MITKEPKLVKCPKCKSAWYVKEESKKKIKLTRCPYCDELVVLIKAKKSAKINIKIIIPLYYTENDDKTINIDEECMRDEFEAKLKSIIGAIDIANDYRYRKTFKVSVNWETDGEIVDLPKVVEIPKDIDDEEIADYLSDKYGWLVNSYSEID